MIRRRAPWRPRLVLLVFLVALALVWLRLVMLGLGYNSRPAITPPSPTTTPAPSLVRQQSPRPVYTSSSDHPPSLPSPVASRPPTLLLPSQPDSAHLSEMQMDPERRWSPIPASTLAHLERDGATPLSRDCNQSVVAFHNGKYGGLTADMGWALMVSMYAAETASTCVAFSDAWGHGCDASFGGEPRWECFFRPISPGIAARKIKLDSGDQRMRRRVRRDELFGPERGARPRYPRLATSAGVGPTSDLLAWRLVFRWTFQLNSLARARVDAIKHALKARIASARFAGVHIRLGDKVGLRPGPREAGANTYDVNDYAIKLRLFYGSKSNLPPVVFVASDDYFAAVFLGELLGVRVVTSAEPHRDQGFSITEYRKNWSNQAKFDAAVRLWADMELLAEADVFLGTFQSNVGRTVHLMRFDRPANTTLAVDRFGHSRCSARARVSQITSHNFWLCA